MKSVLLGLLVGLLVGCAATQRIQVKCKAVQDKPNTFVCEDP